MRIGTSLHWTGVPRWARAGWGRAALQVLVLCLACFGPLLAGSEPRARIPLVRVGIAQEVEELRVSGDGAWFVGVLGSKLRPTHVSKRETWTFRADGSSVTVMDALGRLRGTVRDTLFAYPEDMESGPLRVGGVAYRGQLLFWSAGGRISAANVVDLESYIQAVLPMELGPQPPERFEALKAQAVAARSYTLANLGRWRDRGYDVLPTIEDQVYGGIGSENPVCSDAVEETRGVFATYDGAPICAYYSSTCGGHTASLGEAWNKPETPYLRGVRDAPSEDKGSFCRESPWFRWTDEWTGAQFDQMLAVSLPRAFPGWNPAKHGRCEAISIMSRSESHRVTCLRLEFEKGHLDLAGDQIRSVIRRPGTGELLRSAILNKVQYSLRKGRIRRVRIWGQGYGHGVGMCQFGAMGMAQAGYRYDQILRFYYRGVELRRFY